MNSKHSLKNSINVCLTIAAPITMPIKLNYETMFQTDLTLSLMQLFHQWHKIAFTSSKWDSKYNSLIQLWIHTEIHPNKTDHVSNAPTAELDRPHTKPEMLQTNILVDFISRVLQDKDTLKCRTQWHTRTPCSNTVASVWLFMQNYSWHFKSFHAFW